LEKAKVTICMPHWQVRELVTISLRAIRKYTRNVPFEMIVVDNGSEDDSLDYLRSLPWIRLIERGKSTPDRWVRAFTTALDLGFDQCRTEYFLIMHTDTIVRHPGWLERMLEAMDSESKCVVGAWKLEQVNPWYEALKRITDTKKFSLWLQRTFLRNSSARQLHREICPRDYCTLYRSEPLRRHKLRFFNLESPYHGYTAGEKMYYHLRDLGYLAEVLETEEMLKYMIHIAHATAGLRPDQRKLNHRRAQKKVERKLHRFFESDWIKDLREDSSLDHDVWPLPENNVLENHQKTAKTIPVIIPGGEEHVTLNPNGEKKTTMKYTETNQHG
jgi:glycosyltransferase involved in cell wall biosynthesis